MHVDDLLFLPAPLNKLNPGHDGGLHAGLVDQSAGAHGRPMTDLRNVHEVEYLCLVCQSHNLVGHSGHGGREQAPEPHHDHRVPDLGLELLENLVHGLNVVINLLGHVLGHFLGFHEHLAGHLGLHQPGVLTEFVHFVGTEKWLFSENRPYLYQFLSKFGQ